MPASGYNMLMNVYYDERDRLQTFGQVAADVDSADFNVLMKIGGFNEDERALYEEAAKPSRFLATVVLVQTIVAVYR